MTKRALALILLIAPLHALEFDTKQFPGLHWRLIGPFRAGRVTAVAGVPTQPNTYYFGTPGGGVWKTTNAGQVWTPIFDREKVASVGAITVAPSDAKVVYVGTGEQTPGKGIYRSADSGATWSNVGLQDVPYIQAIVVHPKNSDIVIVGANSIGFGILWKPLPKSAYTANRGIFKTTNGGKTWTKVFSNDDTLGVVDLCADPSDPRKLYAVLYRAAGTSEIVRSLDAGSTWRPLVSKGLPEKDRGRLGIVVAPGNHGRRLYAVLNQGFFRSDDAGATWHQSTKDPRVVGSAYFSRVFADTRNPDLLYVAQTSLYRSTDGGQTFEPYVGAPSGDDFHVLWIDPSDPARMILGVDQGAVVSVDAGKTWSSWYNQPTGQFYHVSTDNSFPYRVYGAQQDSGTAAVLSRSDYGEIMPQDWISVGGFEYSFIAPDPLNSNLVYSGGWYGTVLRFDKTNSQLVTVFERGEKYRTAQMAPLVFSPQDPHTLYMGTQFVLKTMDGGLTWQEISPDLTGYVEKEETTKNPDKPHPPAITSLSPSQLQPAEMWAGTSNRIVQLTRDAGVSWQNVTPPGLTEPSQILVVEASHHDPATAYVTVGATRESTPPLVLRTHDYGASWQKIITGFPDREMVRVVREDPKRKGLLYAGTDTGVFVSWDDGDHWQSLQLNLPATPITDLEVHANDLVVSTFGRSLWIMDDVTPLREMNPRITESSAYLFPPANAVRTRWDNYQDTPYPVETPTGQNPLDGAIIDYFLKAPSNDVTLTIYDATGSEVRKFSSQSTAPNQAPPNVPAYWFAPPETLSQLTGVNRFAWNLRYPPPMSLPYGYDGNLLEYTEYTLADHAIFGQTPRQQPQGTLVVPGKYTVELRVAGQTLRQPLTVELDPRVKTPLSDLKAQLDLARKVTTGMKTSYEAFQQVAALRKTKNVVAALEKKIEALEKGPRTAPGFGSVNRDLTRLLASVEGADAGPSEAVRRAVQQSCEALDKDLAKWRELIEEARKLAPTLALSAPATAPGCGR